MDSESASSVIAKLKEIKGRLRDRRRRQDDSSADNARRRVLRLELAGQHAPGSGHIGFEIFDKTAFGVTDFLNTSTIAAPLEGAGQNDFDHLGGGGRARAYRQRRSCRPSGRDQPTKASVILEAANKINLAPITALPRITGPSPASVESPAKRSIIDYFRLVRLADEGPDDVSGRGRHRAPAADRTRAVGARDQSTRAGSSASGRVRVNVTAKLNLRHERRDRRGSGSDACRAKPANGDADRKRRRGAQGVAAGSRANLPPDPVSKPEATAAVSLTTVPTGAAHAPPRRRTTKSAS